MKPATYTNEQIIEAGMQLLADKKRVTPFAIRNILGGGNPARIKTIWEESQQNALEGQVVSHRVELPTEFADALAATKSSLDELAMRMYGRAQEVAESRVRETIAAARKAKETAEVEVAEAMDTVEQLDSENARLQEVVEQLQAELKRVSADNSRLQERLTAMTDKAEKATVETKDEKARNRELEKQLTVNETQTRILEAQLIAAQQQQDSLRTARDQARAGQQEALQQLAILQTRLEDAASREGELKQRLEQSQQAEEQAKTTAAELKGRLAALTPDGTAEK
jgi:chromosome segregation ATPase